MAKAITFAFDDSLLDSAFAFCNFDEQKILQRKYFSKMTLCRKGLSDEEILSAFSKTTNDDIGDNMYVDEYSKYCQMLKDVIHKTVSYSRKVDRHIEKLKNFSMALADKIVSSDESNEKWRNQYRRSKALITEYSIKMQAIKEVIRKAKNEYKIRDTEIQSIYRKRFANRLKLARLSKNLPQFYIADCLGLTVAAYHNYENAKREPTLTNLIRLAKVLDVTPNWLLGFE